MQAKKNSKADAAKAAQKKVTDAMFDILESFPEIKYNTTLREIQPLIESSPLFSENEVIQHCEDVEILIAIEDYIKKSEREYTDAERLKYKQKRRSIRNWTE